MSSLEPWIQRSHAARHQHQQAAPVYSLICASIVNVRWYSAEKRRRSNPVCILECWLQHRCLRRLLVGSNEHQSACFINHSPKLLKSIDSRTDNVIIHRGFLLRHNTLRTIMVPAAHWLGFMHFIRWGRACSLFLIALPV